MWWRHVTLGAVTLAVYPLLVVLYPFFHHPNDIAASTPPAPVARRP